MNARFEISRSRDGKVLFNLHAGNGQVILTSQLYESKSNAVRGIESVRANAPLDARYDRGTAASGEFYFILKSANGQVIGRSEMYASVAAREIGIASVKQNVSSAEIDDQMF